MPDESPEPNSVWMGTVATADADGYYPIIGPVNTLATGTFSPKITYGDYTKDAEDYISSLILSDLTGGMNVEDMNEGSDATRCWVTFMDTTRVGKIALNPYVERFTWSGASGTSYPVGVVNDTFYGIIGNEICGFNASSGAFSYTEETITLTPTGKAIPFAGRIFIPCGASGYMIVEESAPGNPTVTNVTSVQNYPSSYVADTPNVDAPTVVAFTVFDQRLWALTVSGALAWSYTGSDNEWNWPYDEARAWYPRLISGYTPKDMTPYYGPDMTPRIAVSTSRGIFLYDWGKTQLLDTACIFPPHPDTTAKMRVWRPGEDLHSAIGLDVWKLTNANVVVPMSGLARDDGMPNDLWGKINDLEPEVSQLFALVGPVSNGASGFDYSDKVGASGTGNGEFANVRGLCVDGNNDVWAADTNNERLQRFDSALTYEAQSGSSGSGDGQFASNNGAWDVAVNGAHLWAVDRGNHRLQRFNLSAVYQAEIDGTFTGWLSNTFGSEGSGTGPNFYGPAQVAVRPSNDDVYVADNGNDRLLRLNSSGVYQAQASFTDIIGVCVDASNNVYVSYRHPSIGTIGIIRKYSAGMTSLLWESTFTGIARHIATDGTYVYVAHANFVAKRNVSNGALVTTWGSSGTGNGQFQNAYGIATDGTYVYVSDRNLDRVQKFSNTGTYTAQWGSSGTDNGKFDGPVGLAIDADGDVYVADQDNNRIQRFSNAGAHEETIAVATGPHGIAISSSDVIWVSGSSHNLTRLSYSSGGAGAGDGNFNYPEAVAINTTSGRIYVADTGNHRIQYFTSAGAYEGQWGGQGTTDGRFNTPVDLDIHQGTGDVYVVDQVNDRIQQFDEDGVFIRAWGSSGTGDGQFSLPARVAVRPDGGGVFVGDATRDDIQIFSSSGTYISKFGQSGTANGQFESISGMAFNPADDTLLYVADMDGERIQTFTFSEGISGLTKPYLAANTGIGWHGRWKGDEVGVQPTYAMVTSTPGRYDLWWGMSDGYLYRMKQRRFFHNPRQGLIESEDDFQEDGEIITSKFDAAMLGFWKIASHMVVFLEEATEDEYITIEYRTDADSTWVDLGTVNTSGKTYLPFGVDPDTQFSSGLKFNWIQFRIRGFRGSDIKKSPLIKSLVFCFIKIPQNASAFNYVVAFPQGDNTFHGRNAHEIRRDLFNLVTAGEMIRLRLHEWDGDNREFRGYLTAVSGDDAASDMAGGQRAVNFIEIAASEVTAAQA